MIINIIADEVFAIDKILQTMKITKWNSSKNIIWCDGYYVKVVDNMLEINVFNPNITKQYILGELMKPIIEQNGIFVRIQSGRLVTQFITNANDNINSIYS